MTQDQVANNCQDVVVDYRHGLLYGDSFFSISLNYNLWASSEEVAAADAKLAMDSMDNLYMYTEWGNPYDALEIASTKMSKLTPIADEDPVLPEDLTDEPEPATFLANA